MWAMDGNEAGGDVILMQTSLHFSCKSCWSYANLSTFTREIQRGLYQIKVKTPTSLLLEGRSLEHTTAKWATEKRSMRMLGPSSLIPVSKTVNGLFTYCAKLCAHACTIMASILHPCLHVPRVILFSPQLSLLREYK